MRPAVQGESCFGFRASNLVLPARRATAPAARKSQGPRSEIPRSHFVLRLFVLPAESGLTHWWSLHAPKSWLLRFIAARPKDGGHEQSVVGEESRRSKPKRNQRRPRSKAGERPVKWMGDSPRSHRLERDPYRPPLRFALLPLPRGQPFLQRLGALTGASASQQTSDGQILVEIRPVYVSSVAEDFVVVAFAF